MFFGLIKTKLVCPTCHCASVKFDPFSTISLPMPYRSKVSPLIHFLPLDPNAKISILKISLTENETMETISESISTAIGRNVSVVLAKVSNGGETLNFLKSPEEMISSNLYYAFEVDTEKFYAVTYPCSLNSGVFKSSPQILARPFLIELPSETSTAEELEPILNEFFSYLFEPLPQDVKISTKFAQIVENSAFFDPPTDKKIVAILEKHLFSKTMKFKPDHFAPCIAKRRVFAVINKDILADSSKFNFLKLRSDTQRITNTGQPSITLNSCFEMFEMQYNLPETDKWMCPHCHAPVCASSEMKIWFAPKILIIHLKRFYPHKKGYVKCDAEVEFPDIFDIAPYLVHPMERTKYKLYGVINHMGTMSSGHYISHCLVNEKWFEFNDSSTSECGLQAVHARSSYVLFYQLIE